jgi:hypothetical protein
MYTRESGFSQTFRFLSSLKQETPTVPCLNPSNFISAIQHYKQCCIILHHFGKLNPDPHQSGKLDPGQHQSEKYDLDLQQSEEVEALEGHFRALEVPNLGVIGSGF